MLAGAARAADCAGLPPVARVMVLDQQSRTTQRYEEQRVLRQFALFSYRNLADDIVLGYGPWLDTMAQSFAVACPDRVALSAWLRELLRQSDSAADFSRRIAVAQAAATASPATEPAVR